jgi:Protein of unknown function (DUF3592)
VKIRIFSPRILFISACWMFPAGFVLLGLAAFFTWRTSNFIQRSQAAAGIVTALKPVTRTDSDSNSDITYAPVFSFKAADGKAYSVTSHASSDPPGFDVGDEVTVLYDPSNPQQARIDTFWQLWAVPVVLGSIGTFFFIIASVFVFAFRALARRAALATPPHPSITRPPDHPTT